MTDTNHNPSQQNLRDNLFERHLAAELAELFEAGPRSGLEERILANLRAEQTIAGHSWHRWPAIAALAATILLALSVPWKSGKPSQKITAEHQPPINDGVRPQVATNGTNHSNRQPETSSRPRRELHSPRPAASVDAPLPRLQQFPSPQPLSKQEEILARYVIEHRTQAVLVARARMAGLKRDLAEELQASAAANPTSNQPVSQQEINKESRN